MGSQFGSGEAFSFMLEVYIPAACGCSKNVEAIGRESVTVSNHWSNYDLDNIGMSFHNFN